MESALFITVNPGGHGYGTGKVMRSRLKVDIKFKGIKIFLKMLFLPFVAVFSDGGTDWIVITILVATSECI